MFSIFTTDEKIVFYQISMIVSVHHLVIVQSRVDVNLAVHMWRRIRREVVKKRALSYRVLDGLLLMQRGCRIATVAVDSPTTASASRTC